MVIGLWAVSYTHLREEVVKTEIEDNDNNNLTIPQVVNRLGMVFFLLFFNLGITIFVFLLTGMMLFSQILFIIFAMFLPISFLLSMIPSYESMAKQAIVRVFNTIMTRAGITLIVTVAFSISSMFYNLSLIHISRLSCRVSGRIYQPLWDAGRSRGT